LAARVGARGLFAQLLDMFRFYMGFEINNLSGTALTEKEMTDLHYDAVRDAQRTVCP
jgi:intron-binding protein aquarius